MLYSNNTSFAIRAYGLERAVEMMIEAGFPAIDISFSALDMAETFSGDWKGRFEAVRKMADDAGVIINQGHAPFGGGYNVYVNEKVPFIPKVLEASAILGIDNLVVHPLQTGRYYGREKELFDMNMEFYRGLAPYAKSTGVKISIENMWQVHPVTRHIVDDVCADPHELVAYYDTLDDADAFTICLDIGHVALCNREPEDAVRIIGHDRLGSLHVHDVDYLSDLHTLPGASRINWENVCKALGEIDYKGAFTLEADGFCTRYPKELFPSICKLMNDVAKFYSDKVDSYRPAK